MQISTLDIKTMIDVINTTAQRGAFRGDELLAVGTLHTKLTNILAEANLPSTETESANTEPK